MIEQMSIGFPVFEDIKNRAHQKTNCGVMEDEGWEYGLQGEVLLHCATGGGKIGSTNHIGESVNLWEQNQ